MAAEGKGWAPVPDTRWREIHQELVERVTDQQAKFGMERDERLARDFCEPIMRKVEANHLEEQYTPPAKPKKQAELAPWGQRPGDGQWVNGPEGRRRRGVQIEGRHEEDLGALSVATAPYQPKRKRRGKLARRIVQFFDRLAKLPEWKIRIDEAAFMRVAARGVLDEQQREKLENDAKQKLVQIYLDAVRLFGDPLKEKARRIQVG